MTTRDIDVVAAGHICVDITPAFGPVSGPSVADILRPGKLLLVGQAAVNSGGAVSNVGLALRRLGLTVSLMGKCGDDPFGRIILDVLRREAPGAEAGMRVVPGERTSYTVVLVPPGIDRMFLHCPGANDTFGLEDVDPDIVGRARLFHFGYPPVMKRMFECGGRELTAVMRLAREAGAITSLDMALPDPDSEAGRADWRDILAGVLPHTDVFLPSLEELMFMLRRDRFDELTDAGPGIVDAFSAQDVRCLAQECLGMGARTVVIKCGHVGAYLRTSPSAQWPDVELFEPTCRVQHVVSAAGAGDASISGFLAAMLRGESAARCMATLAAVGAQSMRTLDALSGIRSWEETLRQLDSVPEKNPLPDRLDDLAT